MRCLASYNETMSMNRGFLYALLAYLTWGLLPIYWKALQELPALEIMGHRIVWSLIVLAIVLAVRQQGAWIYRLNRRTLLTFAAISVLLGLNWYTYIWAVNAGYVVETSLGYFINPLVNVSLGALFLHERLRRLQYGAVALACAGVLYLTLRYGSIPWIALTLAFTFGFYGLLKKTALLDSLQGLSLEMLLLLPLAAGYLLHLHISGEASFPHVPLSTQTLMMAAGVITALPLLAFAAAARRIPLASLGLMQYIAPSLQFCLGVFLYNEPFTQDRMVGYGLIWLALTLYSAEVIFHSWRRRTDRYPNRTPIPALAMQHAED